MDFISLEIPFTPKNNSILLKTLFRIITIGKIIFKFQTIINRIQPKLIFYTMSLGAILLPLIKTKAKKYTSRILLVHLLLIINYFFLWKKRPIK